MQDWQLKEKKKWIAKQKYLDSLRPKKKSFIKKFWDRLDFVIIGMWFFLFLSCAIVGLILGGIYKFIIWII